MVRTLTLAKMEEPLAIRWSRPFTGTPTAVTITRDPAGRYFVSFLVEEEIPPLPPGVSAVGLDLGLHDVVVFHTGEKVGNPHFFGQDEATLATAQRRPNGVSPRSAMARRTRRKRAGRWSASMRALPIVAPTFSTNSRPASFVRTKRSASRVCA
jgi:transposase